MSSHNFVMPNMMDMFAKGGGSDVLFPFSTAAQSPALYKANIYTLQVEALTQPQLKIDAQFHDHAAVSADGARVPYNVIARADVDLSKPQPTAIYGYGGFAAALVPSWAGTWLAAGGDRKSCVLGKSVSVRVDSGGPRILKKKKN